MSFGQYIMFSAPIGLFAAIITWPTGESTPPEPVAQEFVNVFKGVFPKSAGGVHVAAPTAEGDTLVFTITPSSDLLDTFSSAEMETLNVNAACMSGKGLKGFFDKGGKLRFDIKNPNGGLYHGKPRSSC